jgi:hypothetical protein
VTKEPKTCLGACYLLMSNILCMDFSSTPRPSITTLCCRLDFEAAMTKKLELQTCKPKKTPEAFIFGTAGLKACRQSVVGMLWAFYHLKVM